MEIIQFNGKVYPKFQSEGNAARWIMPYAKHFCKGKGVDIGCNRKEWKFDDALSVDPEIMPGYTAMDFPANDWDYIFSSHCLEHVKENWYNVLDYWLSKLKVGGILFLYLPHKSQEYWLPKNNRKHIHSFDGSEIAEYLRSLGHQVFLSGVDLNNAFVLVCEKKCVQPIVKEPVLTDQQKQDFVCKWEACGSQTATISGEDLKLNFKRKGTL